MAHRPLNQVIAILKGVKSRFMSRCNEIHNQLQSSDALNGHTRTYVPRMDGDPVYPGEDKHVQVLALDHLHEMALLTTEMFDTEAALDFANCHAKANVVVDGQIIVENAPATYLIFLEKQLVDLQTTLAKLVVLDPAKRWEVDSGSRLSKALPVASLKTKKVERPLIVVAATKEHPAQAKTTTEDIIEGTWTTQPLSGAVSTASKKQYLDRLQRLIDAVKVAREQANMVDASPVKVGASIMEYIGL